MGELKCFLDLDGVLADFMTDICKAHCRPDPYQHPVNAGAWDVPGIWNMTAFEFFVPCIEAAFWENLKPTSDGLSIYKSLCTFFGPRNITILTRPTRHAGAYAGKYNWVCKHVGRDVQMLMGDCPKEALARPEHVLIDDCDKNVDAWRQAGGTAILVPRMWNRGYPLVTAGDTNVAVRHLESELAHIGSQKELPVHVGPVELLTPVLDKLIVDSAITPSSKLTNPKQECGSSKLPLHLWPETATITGVIGMLDGALKYGRSNYRVAGVQATIYLDACKRHINYWLEGEECAQDNGVPHLAHAIACLAIVIDARAAGKLNDDRMVAGGYAKLAAELTPHVNRLKKLYADKHPKHYTIADNVKA